MLLLSRVFRRFISFPFTFRNYILPDVTCDFSQVTFEQTAPDVVSVR